MNLKEWREVGPLSKTVAFRTTKKISPIDSLHKAIKELAPRVKEISDVAVSTKTNEYLKVKLTKYAKGKWDFLADRKIESEVAFAMLDSSPCDLDGPEVKDFVLYVRKKSRKQINA